MEPTVRQKIDTLLAQIKSYPVVTPDHVVLLDSYLNVPEEELPEVLDRLTQLASELEQIQADAAAEEQKLLDEYMLELKEITTKAQKLSLEFSEAVDREQDDATGANLLQQLEQQ